MEEGIMELKSVRGKRNTGLAALLFVISILPVVAKGSNVNASAPVAREVNQTIVNKTAAGQSGFIAWLESLLPGGIRLTGPSILSNTQPEVLATASCYNSGAGISCNGFKSFEEYLAAVHASQNLGIPIQRLKENMQSGKTLHQAIRELRPTANAQIETWKAEQQAQQTLRESSS
jgi:hypothetical protein